MSNRKPNTSGITKRWQPGYDARCLLEKRLLDRCFDPRDIRWKIDTFLEELMALVDSNERTVFIGVGTFKWSPWRTRVPRTGEVKESWHLAFKPCRYREGKYDGNR